MQRICQSAQEIIDVIHFSLRFLRLAIISFPLYHRKLTLLYLAVVEQILSNTVPFLSQ